jgi:hypothetical protein
MSDQPGLKTSSTTDSSVLVSEPPLEAGFGWPSLIAEVVAFHHLEKDWDGQGAESPDPALVEGAIVLARRFQAEGQIPADRVTVGVNGTIFLSWHGTDGFREVEVVSPTEAEVRFVPSGSMVTDESVLTW